MSNKEDRDAVLTALYRKRSAILEAKRNSEGFDEDTVALLVDLEQAIDVVEATETVAVNEADVWSKLEKIAHTLVDIHESIESVLPIDAEAEQLVDAAITRQQDGRIRRPLKRSDPRTWQDGMQDAVKLVERRLEHYEHYRNAGSMKTHPVVFAILDEILVLLKGALGRTQLADPIAVD